MIKRSTLNRLRNIEGFLFDNDGTLVLGNRDNTGFEALPGAVRFLKYLSKKDMPYAVLTNGTVRTAVEYASKLQAIGLPVDASSMLTPSSVAAEYFSRSRYRRIMVLGCPGVWRPLADAGLDIVLSSERQPGRVDAVYFGWYREFTMHDLEAAVYAVLDGAVPYNASDAPFFATAQGRGIGTSCAIAAMLKSMTGKNARILGKPSLEALRCAGRRIGVPLKNLAVVGDDPDLEVPMAHKGRSLSVYVHTGTGDGDAFRAGSRAGARPPDISVAGIRELMDLLI